MGHQNNQSSAPPMSRYRRYWRYWPLIAELWIVATIVAFFVIRILGSGPVRHFLHLSEGR
jgi:hypothetical protein